MRKGQKRASFRMIQGGKDYVARRKNNVVTVTVSQTAKGQYLHAGNFDLKTRTWQEDNHRCSVPIAVKTSIETVFNEIIAD